MSTEQNKAVLRRAYEIVSAGNIDALDEVIASNIVDHDPGPGQGQGLEGVKGLFTGLRAAFPDMQMVAEDLIAEGDKLVARVNVRGTHQGDFMGIPATGRQVSMSVIDIVRITDGKIVEHWGIGEDLKLLQQLGATPGS